MAVTSRAARQQQDSLSLQPYGAWGSFGDGAIIANCVLFELCNADEDTANFPS